MANDESAEDTSAYLSSLSGDAAERITAMKWARYLGAAFGPSGALSALRYYAGIGWISEDVRRSMLDYVRGLTIEELELSAIEPDLHGSLENLEGTEFERHARSLQFVAAISGRSIEHGLASLQLAESIGQRGLSGVAGVGASAANQPPSMGPGGGPFGGSVGMEPGEQAQRAARHREDDRRRRDERGGVPSDEETDPAAEPESVSEPQADLTAAEPESASEPQTDPAVAGAESESTTEQQTDPVADEAESESTTEPQADHTADEAESESTTEPQAEPATEPQTIAEQQSGPTATESESATESQADHTAEPEAITEQQTGADTELGSPSEPQTDPTETESVTEQQADPVATEPEPAPESSADEDSQPGAVADPLLDGPVDSTPDQRTTDDNPERADDIEVSTADVTPGSSRDFGDRPVPPGDSSSDAADVALSDDPADPEPEPSSAPSPSESAALDDLDATFDDGIVDSDDPVTVPDRDSSPPPDEERCIALTGGSERCSYPATEGHYCHRHAPNDE